MLRVLLLLLRLNWPKTEAKMVLNGIKLVKEYGAKWDKNCVTIKLKLIQIVSKCDESSIFVIVW